MPKITPFLWFQSDLQGALDFYTSIFITSHITNIRLSPDGTPFAATFTLENQTFMAFAGGPQFVFSEAVSFFVTCKDQAEVDYFWERLLEGGGVAQQCGWLKDRYGVSWQVIPDALGRYLSDPDPEKRNRCQEVMMRMVKIDVEALEQAYKGEESG